MLNSLLANGSELERKWSYLQQLPTNTISESDGNKVTQHSDFVTRKHKENCIGLWWGGRTLNSQRKKPHYDIGNNFYNNHYNLLHNISLLLSLSMKFPLIVHVCCSNINILAVMSHTFYTGNKIYITNPCTVSSHSNIAFCQGFAVRSQFTM